MPLCLTPRIERISSGISGRRDSLFARDCADRGEEIQGAVAGRRVLIAGGAGSIGSATLVQLLNYAPSAVCVLDTNENNLAELVREVRSRNHAWNGLLQVQPLDYGSPLARTFLLQALPFDLVLSYAALKHVRSERDEFSVLRMLEVNLVKADRFLGAIREAGHGSSGVFLVSTDKAARPVSLMGASKRAMELLLWAHCDAATPRSMLDGGSAPPLARATCSRFANVAFSDGSLSWGFLQRLEKFEPLAAPVDIQRYFLSPVEAGQLCLLASTLCPHKHLLVPRLDTADLATFVDVATATLREFQLSPIWFEDAGEAREAVSRAVLRGEYPVVLTRGDTDGEKEIEEFIASGESVAEIDLFGAQSISARPGDFGPLMELLRIIEMAVSNGAVPSKRALVEALSRTVPDFVHRETGLHLDCRM